MPISPRLIADAASAAGNGARRRRHRRRHVEDRLQGRGSHRRARRRRAVAVRDRMVDQVGQGSGGDRGRAARGEADRPPGRAGADHRDPARIRLRQQRRRPVVERRPRPAGRAARSTPTPRLGGFAPASLELGVDVAVIISDTFGRAWREGQTDIAIGIAGMQPIHSYIGQFDPHGHEFKVQAVCLARRTGGRRRAGQGKHLAGARRCDPRLRVGARRHGDDRAGAARPEPRSVQIAPRRIAAEYSTAMSAAAAALCLTSEMLASGCGRRSARRSSTTGTG